MAPFYEWGLTASKLDPFRGASQVHSWNIHFSISKLIGKTEYAKHVVRNITFSKAAGEDNITGQTASAQVLFYLNVHLFATIMSIQGIWDVCIPPYTHTSISTSKNGMRGKFVQGIWLVQ